MTDRTISLRSDLVERLETLAHNQGRSVDEIVTDALEQYAAPIPPTGNWALALAQGMETTPIDWLDDPDASTNSRAYFEQYLRDKAQRVQSTDAD